MRVAQAEAAIMEVYVNSPSFRFSNFVFVAGSVVGDVLNRFVQKRVSLTYDLRWTPSNRHVYSIDVSVSCCAKANGQSDRP